MTGLLFSALVLATAATTAVLGIQLPAEDAWVESPSPGSSSMQINTGFSAR